MTDLSFAVLGARPEPHAAVPTMVLVLRITVPEGCRVHALALRCQIRIEPQRRRYGADEQEHLYDLFGATAQWGDSLHPFLWTHVSTTVGQFAGPTEIDLPVPCSYDMEVAGSRYLHTLADGEVPLVVLFSGTLFTVGPTGFAAEPVPWDREASFRLPLAVWRQVMDQYFPNCGWLRVDRPTLDRLLAFKSRRGLPTWDQAVEQLLKEAGEEEP